MLPTRHGRNTAVEFSRKPSAAATRPFKYRVNDDDDDDGTPAQMVTAEDVHELTREIFKTIFVNDFDGLQKIYAERDDLSTDILDEHGMTPLQHASYKGNEEMVRWLLDRVSLEFSLFSGTPSPHIFKYILIYRLFFVAGRRRQFRKA